MKTTTTTPAETVAALKRHEIAAAEIVDCETLRVHFLEDESDPDSEQTEDLDADEIAALFGDDCGEIDEDMQVVYTWEE